MQTLTKDLIFQADDLKVVPVEVPEWGGQIFVRSMKSIDRDRMEALVTSTDPKAKTNLRAQMVVMTACLESGEPLFTQADVGSVGNKSAAAVDRIFTAALKLNNFSDEDVAVLEKN